MRRQRRHRGRDVQRHTDQLRDQVADGAIAVRCLVAGRYVVRRAGVIRRGGAVGVLGDGVAMGVDVRPRR